MHAIQWLFPISLIVCTSFFAIPPIYSEESIQPKEIQFSNVPYKGAHSLEELLWKRKSIRAFTQEIPSWETIGQLLWAAQGINRPADKHRTVPSAGGTYPLEIYVLRPDGVYHYQPDRQSVVQVREGNVWEALSQAGLKPSSVYQSPCVFLFYAVFERTSEKFKDQAPRYIYLEGGHAAQNLILQANALGLGTVPIGADLKQETNTVLGIPTEQKFIYVLASGFPATTP